MGKGNGWPNLYSIDDGTIDGSRGCYHLSRTMDVPVDGLLDDLMPHS